MLCVGKTGMASKRYAEGRRVTSTHSAPPSILIIQQNHGVSLFHTYILSLFRSTFPFHLPYFVRHTTASLVFEHCPSLCHRFV